jgi:hypothetical protein
LEVFLASAELAENIGAGGALGGVGAGDEAPADFEFERASAVVQCIDGVDTGVGVPPVAQKNGEQFLG